MHIKTPKYLTHTCQKCKNVFALEVKSTHKQCPTIIGYTIFGKPIRCNASFPNQKERDKLEQEQYHPSFFPI